MKKLITMSFLPHCHDGGLFTLRLWLGFSMFYIHGLDKLKGFGETVEQFQKGGFPWILAVAAILAESIGSVFLIIGFATRWAALVLGSTMAVAFFKAHGAVLKGTGSGELAFLYLGGFVALLVAGAGRWSVDAKLSK